MPSPSRLLLRHGTVIDGTGAPRRRADVLIERDRIAAVDTLEAAEGARVIDCTGLVVAPGFIDTHNHSDGWLLKIPHLVSKTTQGFTTEVLASDGISYAPVSAETAPEWLYYLRALDGLLVSDYRGWHSVGDYLDLLDRQTAQNVVMQTPYANVRALAKGWDRLGADDTQIRHMQHEVRLAMEQGAVGVSTGLDYINQCFATTAEIAEVCRAMQPWQGLYVTHVRYKKGVIAGIEEAVEIGRRAEVPVHISHLKCDNAELAEQMIEYIDRVATKQVDFSFDVYPYLPGSTMLSYFLPYEVWEQGPLAALAKLRCSVVRRRLAAFLACPTRPPLERCRLAWLGSKVNSCWLGRSLADYVEASGCPAADAICNLLIEENLAVLCVLPHGNDDHHLVEPFLVHAKFMLGSDGIFHADGTIHPRQYASAPRILGPLVRDRKLFTLEEAVRKLSGWPACRFGLTDRGEVRPGAFADLVVFDPDTIADRATFQQPHQLSVGVKHVLVNGVAVIADAAPVEPFAPGAWPGRALRFRQ